MYFAKLGKRWFNLAKASQIIPYRESRPDRDSSLMIPCEGYTLMYGNGHMRRLDADESLDLSRLLASAQRLVGGYDGIPVLSLPEAK